MVYLLVLCRTVCLTVHTLNWTSHKIRYQMCVLPHISPTWQYLHHHGKKNPFVGILEFVSSWKLIININDSSCTRGHTFCIPYFLCCSGTALTDDSTINTTSQLVLGETGSCCCPHAALPGETLVRSLIANKLIICSYLMNSSSCDDWGWLHANTQIPAALFVKYANCCQM